MDNDRAGMSNKGKQRACEEKIERCFYDTTDSRQIRRGLPFGGRSGALPAGKGRSESLIRITNTPVCVLFI